MLAPRVAWPIALLVFASCSQPPKAVLFGPGTELTAEDFPRVRETWTRSQKVYKGLDNRLFVKATYHSPEFRRAFAVAFPDIYGHGGKITRRELVELTGDVEQYHTFFVVAYTANRKWNDLEQPDSIWRLTLRGKGDVSVSPHEILSVKIDENIRTVYSPIHRFDEAYLVRFPLTDPLRNIVITPESEEFTLRIASSLGVAELEWELIPPTSKPAPTE